MSDQLGAAQHTLPFVPDDTAAEEAPEGDWVADIAVDAPGKDVYSYRVPPELMQSLAVGDGVEVPYGGRRVRGFVWRRHAQPPSGVRLRAIAVHRQEIHLPPHLLAVVGWAAGYYRCHLGSFLAAAVPAPVREGVRLRPTRMVAPHAESGATLTKRQRQVLELLPEQPIEWAAALRLACCSSSVLERLAAVGAVHVEEHRTIDEHHLISKEESFALSDEQQVAVDAVAASLSQHNVFLLYGVTGSGKTLVYLDLAQRVISQGQQVLVLLPEISLTPQLAARFRRRFARVAVWHSGFSAGERAEQWQRVASGAVDLVIGTRSALFAPLPDIGLIVVDEEHDPSYKQDSEPRYQGRDLAVVYARQLGIPIILGTATPSLESYHNAIHGRYTPLTLKQRPGGGALPTPLLVDMAQECRAQGRKAVVSQALIDHLRLSCERGEQGIVLLNRRGWAPIVECLACGHVVMCPHCDIGLTYHKGSDQLRCHYCGYETAYPDACPACHEPALSSKGLGTEQLEHLLKQAVPGMRTLRVDADTVGRKHAHARMLSRFAQGEADCLVGTQMVAKGLDFPKVTTVGVIQADRGLSIPDFRAAERTFQLVAQVAGRAGRGSHPGTVVVQAFDTEAPALRCALSLAVKRFYTAELQQRAEHSYPPHAGMLRFLWSGPSLRRVQNHAETVAGAITPLLNDCRLLGPTPSGITMIKDQQRWHALVKGPSRRAIQRLMDRIAAANIALDCSGVRCAVDVDPITIC